MSDIEISDEDDSKYSFLLNKLSNFEAPKKKRGRPPVPQSKGKNVSVDPMMQILSALTKSIEGLEKGMNDLNSNMQMVVNKISSFETEVKHISTEQIKQSNEMKMLSARIEELERHTREKQILVTSPEFGSIERELETKVCECLKTKLSLDELDVKCLEVCRLGRNKNTVLVALPSLKIKRKFFISLCDAKQNRSSEVKNFFINEFLTPQKSFLYKELRDLKKRDGTRFYSVFAFHGEIYVKYTKDGDRKVIHSTVDV